MEKKRVFVRVLFGEFAENWVPEENHDIPQTHQFVKSRKKIQKDIKARRDEKRKLDCITYVYGKKNEEILKSYGFKTVLIHDEPYMWGPEKKRIWWHKLHAYRYIANEDGISEFVFLDWDCFLNKNLFSNFWERLNQKEDFQSPLCRYGTSILGQSKYRKSITSKKIVPNGGFVYIRDKSIPDKIWEFSNVGGNKWLDEAAYAKYVDDRMGEWIGTKRYWDLFEPEVVRWNGKGPFKLVRKDNCFRHR
jgi:hypothetical protein